MIWLIRTLFVLAGILFVLGGFLVGYITGLNYQIKKIKQALNQLEEFIKDESNVEEKSKKENHEYNESYFTCPAKWKNCPGTNSDGKIFPGPYAISDGGAEGDGV